MVTQRSDDNLTFEEAQYAIQQIEERGYYKNNAAHAAALARSVNSRFYNGKSVISLDNTRAFMDTVQRLSLTRDDFLDSVRN